jgi:FkbM family methyltransferase
MSLANTLDIARLSRVPKRCIQDLKLIYMLKNWREVLSAEWHKTSLDKIVLRSGISLSGPSTIDLAFLFHEIWIKRNYTPAGYEVNRNHVVIDIGANIGVFAAYAATRASGVKVYAYEPFPENVRWLKKNIEDSRLKNVKILQQAVAGNTGIRNLKASNSNWIVHSLSAQNDEDGMPVDSISLNDLMAREEIKQCDLLKLDCEGSEYEILQNCKAETLKSVKRIVAEYHEGPSYPGTGKDLCAFLKSHSFRIDSFQPVDINCGYLRASNTKN